MIHEGLLPDTDKVADSIPVFTQVPNPVAPISARARTSKAHVSG